MHSRTFVGAIVAAVAIAATLSTAFAAGPYVRGQKGYDIGWPQCGAAVPAGAYGVVGVNQGRPFDSNPCLASQYSATPHAALYINTGYDPIYTQPDHTTPECVDRSDAAPGDKLHRAAWAAGCSEAEKSMAYSASQGAQSPVALWLDVEIDNSWSASDLTLNQSTLQGLVDTIHAASGAPVGAYSTGFMWSQIVGGNRVSGLDADWIATGALSARLAAAYCSHGFSGSPVRLVQYVPGATDSDYAC